MRQFYLNRSGLNIYCQEYLPCDFDNTKKYQAILISHGFGATIADCSDHYMRFTDNGIAVYGLEFLGGARSDSTHSQGSSLDMSIYTEVSDLEALIDYVRELEYIDSEKMMLMGFSQGAFVSGITAARRANDIARLIMVYPALCMCDDARRGQLGGATYDINNIPQSWDCPNGMVISKQFHEAVVDIDPLGELMGYDKDVLIIHGMEDDIVHYSYSIRAKNKAYSKEKSQLLIMEKMGHCVPDTVYDAVFDSINFFIEGKKELLTIKVIITDNEVIEDTPGRHVNKIYFTGYCDSPMFKGAILPGACDTQITEEGVTRLRAVYTLFGKDSEGNTCTINIVNSRQGQYFRPVITTDSKALAYLNDEACYGTLEHHDYGVTIRIWK
ncbi:MAG: alpha/beta hydrolase [Pseudobutyrivibrio sp.]|nr:alpha/beta hydrolase [Pseudobutyrivibrio sp.]